MWKPHFVPPFLGYKEVLVFADGDSSGTKFAEEVASTLPNARVIQSPDGYDVNSLVDERGRQYFIERVNNVTR
jgi:DNA primase